MDVLPLYLLKSRSFRGAAKHAVDINQNSLAPGKALVTVASVMYNMIYNQFHKNHPSSKALISSTIGKGTTAVFNSGVYNH